jgi:ATP-dependent DNA helicase RecQ
MNINAIHYHAGLNYEVRSQRQQQWINQQVRVMIATNAFGMGIDKADVRVVVHMDVVDSMEAYYQEAGRAGRDGRRAYAVIVHGTADIINLKSKVLESQPEFDFVKRIYQALANYYQLPIGSAGGESFEFQLDDFCKRFNEKPLPVFSALKKMQEAGLIQFNDSFYQPSRIHISSDKKSLYEFQVAHEHFDPILKSLLRLYGAELFSAYVPISEFQLAKSMKKTNAECKTMLKQLDHLQKLHYEPATDAPRVTFLMARQDADRLPVDKKKMEERRNVHLAQMESMVNYVSQTHRCRMQVIQEYFNEETFSTCGVCDVCIARKKKENQTQIADYRNQVLVLLKSQRLTTDELENAVNPADHELFIEIVREMLDEGLIRYDDYWVLSRVQ